MKTPWAWLCLLVLLLGSPDAVSGRSIADNYAVMSAGTRLLLSSKVDADFSAPDRRWILYAVQGMPGRLPWQFRYALASVALYEARRAGLDPALILALIQVESDFRKYAISSAGALGLMQVMPFWQDEIGQPAHDLFDMRQNIRFGCLVLRHYLDHEKGDMSRALARYNGSLGRLDYPNTVFTVLATWQDKLP